MNATRRFAGPLTILLIVAACSGGPSAASPTTPGATAPSPAAPGSSAPAIDRSRGPIGTDVPPRRGRWWLGNLAGGFIDPKPGQLDVHPVRMDLLTRPSTAGTSW